MKTFFDGVLFGCRAERRSAGTATLGTATRGAVAVPGAAFSPSSSALLCLVASTVALRSLGAEAPYFISPDSVLSFFHGGEKKDEGGEEIVTSVGALPVSAAV